MLMGMGCDTSTPLHVVMAKVLSHHNRISPCAGAVSGVPGFMQGGEAMGKQSRGEAVSPLSKAIVSQEPFGGAHGSSMSFPDGKSLPAPLVWFLR